MKQPARFLLPRSITLVAATLVLTLSTTGCTFYGIAYDNNGYTPAATGQAEQPIDVTVVTFASRRNPGDPQIVGQDLKCEKDDPMIWVTDALTRELQAAGFKVQTAAAEADALTDAVITGSVDKFILGAWTGVCDARMTIHVKKGGQLLLEQNYSTYQRPGVITKKQYRVNFEPILNGLMIQAVPDIIDALE